jgi:hypothetical protein
MRVSVPPIATHALFATSATSGARRRLDRATALLAARTRSVLGCGGIDLAA